MNKRQLEVQKANTAEEQKVIRQLKQVYNQAKKDCEARIAELNSRTDMQNLQAIVYQKQYQEALKKQIEGILDTLQSNQFNTITEYLGTSYENGFLGALYDLQGQGIPLIIPIDQSQVVQALQTDSKISTDMYTRLGEDVNYLKRSIKAELSRGTANGSSWLEIAARIATGMNSPFNKALNNSLRIARTEGHRVQQQAQWNTLQTAKEKGADVVKQWDSTLDDRTRADHKILDGQIRELDDYFEVGGYRAMYPGAFGVASEDIHCRCCMLQRAKWALDEDELHALEERAAYYGLDKTKDFDEFKERYLQLPENEATIELSDEVEDEGQPDSEQDNPDPVELRDEVRNEGRSDSEQDNPDLVELGDEAKDVTMQSASAASGIKDCQDFSSLQQYMKNTYGVTVDAAVEKLDYASVQQSMLGIERVMKEFPQAQAALKAISTSDTGVMCANYRGTIDFNPRYYSEASKLTCMEQGKSTGFHPKNNNVLTTGSHEMGHLLERTLIEKAVAHGKYSSGISAWINCREAKAVISEASKAAKASKQGRNPKTGKLYRIAELEAQVSGYALQDRSECLAECVADYVANGEDASILSKEVWKILKRELG